MLSINPQYFDFINRAIKSIQNIPVFYALYTKFLKLVCVCAQSGFLQKRLWFSGHDQVPCSTGDVTMGEGTAAAAATKTKNTQKAAILFLLPWLGS